MNDNEQLNYQEASDRVYARALSDIVAGVGEGRTGFPLNLIDESFTYQGEIMDTEASRYVADDVLARISMSMNGSKPIECGSDDGFSFYTYWEFMSDDDAVLYVTEERSNIIDADNQDYGLVSAWLSAEPSAEYKMELERRIAVSDIVRRQRQGEPTDFFDTKLLMNNVYSEIQEEPKVNGKFRRNLSNFLLKASFYTYWPYTPRLEHPEDDK